MEDNSLEKISNELFDIENKNLIKENVIFKPRSNSLLILIDIKNVSYFEDVFMN